MLELSIIHRAFLELIKISIGTSNNDFDFSQLSDEDWERVYDESKKQASVLICFDAFKNVDSKPCSEIFHKWFFLATANLKSNINIINEQERLIALLNDNDIPYVILKGLSSAAYYKDGGIRRLGDIDFLVDNTNVEKTKELLVASGYQLDHETSDIHYELCHYITTYSVI